MSVPTDIELPQHSDASVSPWVRISPDNSVTLVVSQSEIGQGISTTLASILADELYVPLPRVRIEFAPVAPVYREPSTYSVKTPPPEPSVGDFLCFPLLAFASLGLLCCSSAALSVHPAALLRQRR